jgi:hypothetical protein
MEYPVAFLREIDGVTKDEILKDFVDVIFEDTIDLATIPNEKLKKAWFRLMLEADKAAKIMEANLATLESGARENRMDRRNNAVKRRARKAGLITVEAKAPKKLILE